MGEVQCHAIIGTEARGLESTLLLRMREQSRVCELIIPEVLAVFQTTWASPCGRRSTCKSIPQLLRTLSVCIHKYSHVDAVLFQIIHTDNWPSVFCLKPHSWHAIWSLAPGRGSIVPQHGQKKGSVLKIAQPSISAVHASQSSSILLSSFTFY